MFGRFRPNPPNVGAISARPKSHEHWGPPCSGDFGQSDPNVRAISAGPKSHEHWGPQCSGDFGQAEKPRTLGRPKVPAFRPGRNRPNIESPEHWGGLAEIARTLGGFWPKSPEHWGPQCSWLFGLAEIAPTLGGVWPESPEHWGGFGRNRPNIGGQFGRNRPKV